MKYQCLIIDDEPLARKVIHNYLADTNDFEVIGEYGALVGIEDMLDETTIDLLFLDINMPGRSGMDFLKEVGAKSMVVLTTAYSEYAVEAFEVEVFDFLVKPISKARFEQTLSRIRNHQPAVLKNDTQFIAIKEGRRLYQVELNKLLYVQAYGDYIRIFCADKTYITKEKLHRFVPLLSDQFLQIHRSYVVNIRKINYVEGNQAFIGNRAIPIAASYKKVLLSRL